MRLAPSAVLASGLALVGLLACGDPAGEARDGAQVYQATCAACHGKDGKPEPSNVARLNVRDLSASEFRARVTPDLVEHQVRAGSKNKIMPSFEGALRDDQIRAVAAYVAGPSFPR